LIRIPLHHLAIHIDIVVATISKEITAVVVEVGTHTDWYSPETRPAYGIGYVLCFLGKNDDQWKSVEDGVELLAGGVILWISWKNDTSSQ